MAVVSFHVMLVSLVGTYVLQSYVFRKERKESYIAHAMISVTLCWTTTVVSSVRPYVIVHLAHEGILVPSGVLMNVANATSLCIKYPFHVATSLQRFHGSFGI